MKLFCEELNLHKEATNSIYLYWTFSNGFLHLQLLLKQPQVS